MRALDRAVVYGSFGSLRETGKVIHLHEQQSPEMEELDADRLTSNVVVHTNVPNVNIRFRMTRSVSCRGVDALSSYAGQDGVM